MVIPVHPGIQLDRIQAADIRSLRVPDVGGRGGLDAGRAARRRRGAHGYRPDLQRT